MAELFCDSDGEIKVQEAIREKGKHPGEYTKIVTGPLAGGNYRCDKCNKPLTKGDTAYYVANLRETFRDPKGEKAYFSMDTIKTFKY